MKKNLDLHDQQILRLISNPIIGYIKLFLTYSTNRILEITISGIKKIEQENIECISLFFESAGGIDSGYIEENENSKQLFISGIIDWNIENYSNINWSFLINAEKISLEYLNVEDKDIDLYIRNKCAE